MLHREVKLADGQRYSINTDRQQVEGVTVDRTIPFYCLVKEDQKRVNYRLASDLIPAIHGKYRGVRR